MLEELKQAPESVFIGQIIFLVSVVAFIVSIIIDIMRTTSLSNYTVYGVIVGCIIGVITSAIAKEKGMKFIIIDIVITAFIFIGYVEVFA